MLRGGRGMDQNIKRNAVRKRTNAVKLAAVLFFGIILIAGTGGICHALSYTNTVNFDDTGTDEGRTYSEIGDVSSLFTFEYSHFFDFDPAALNITSATLTLSHKGNSANPGEAWLISGEGNILLGELLNSSIWVDQAFPLSSDLFSRFSEDTWELALILKENTTGMDKLWIDKSVVTVNYAPVSIPSALVLFGSGLLGLVGIGRKRLRK